MYSVLSDHEPVCAELPVKVYVLVPGIDFAVTVRFCCCYGSRGTAAAFYIDMDIDMCVYVDVCVVNSAIDNVDFSC